LPAAEYTTTYNEALSYVNQELEDIPAADRVTYLVSNNARWRVIWHFENIYSYIFNGQIELLQSLNQRQVSGMSMSEAKVEWVSYKARFGNALDQWELDTWHYTSCQKEKSFWFGLFKLGGRGIGIGNASNSGAVLIQ
jgi:hypothetical protein